MSRNDRKIIAPVNAPDGAASVIDRSFVAELVEGIGWRDYREIIGGLPVEVEQQIAVMETKAITFDLEGIRQAAHKIAGLLSQFGAFEVSRTAERLWETETEHDARQLVVELGHLARIAVDELNALTEQELGAA